MSEINKNFLCMLEKVADAVIENEEFLADLDRKIGDSDHGINLKRGFEAIKADIGTFSDPDMHVSDILNKCAMILITKVGGASGPLYGTAFMKAGMALKGKNDEELLQNETICVAFSEAVKGIKDRGKAEPGDKTMIDVLEPALKKFEKMLDNENRKEIMESVVLEALNGLNYTKTISANKGRASYLGERSIGTEDPGAYSSYIILKTIAGNL